MKAENRAGVQLCAVVFAALAGHLISACSAESSSPSTGERTPAHQASSPPIDSPSSSAPTRAGQGHEPKPAHLNLAVGETARLGYFDVTVHQIKGEENSVEGGGYHGARVTVCYVRIHPDANADGSTNTSTEPWTFGWFHDGEPTWVLNPGGPGESQLSDHWPPAYEPRTLKLEECNTGWITIDIRKPWLLGISGVRYDPSAFDGKYSAEWDNR